MTMATTCLHVQNARRNADRKGIDEIHEGQTWLDERK